MSDYEWVACSKVEFGHVGEQRHLLRQGHLVTVCGHSASVQGIWRKNRIKPECSVCAGSKVNR